MNTNWIVRKDGKEFGKTHSNELWNILYKSTVTRNNIESAREWASGLGKVGNMADAFEFLAGETGKELVIYSLTRGELLSYLDSVIAVDSHESNIIPLETLESMLDDLVRDDTRPLAFESAMLAWYRDFPTALVRFESAYRNLRKAEKNPLPKETKSKDETPTGTSKFM